MKNRLLVTVLCFLSVLCMKAEDVVFVVDGIKYSTGIEYDKDRPAEGIGVKVYADETLYKELTEVVIPDEVTYGDVTYKVVELGSNLNYNGASSKVQKLTIGANVKTIVSPLGKDNLKVIRFMGSEAPSINTAASGSVTWSGITAIAPNGVLSAYQTAYNTIGFKSVVDANTLHAKSIAVSPVGNMHVGDTKDIVYEIVKFDPSDATPLQVNWTSSNPSVATVDANGHIEALAEGTTTITGQTNDAGWAITSFEVTVGPDLALKTTDLSICVFEGRTLRFTGTPMGALTFESSVPTVVHVDAEGHVSGLRGGSAVITVKDGECVVGTCTVEVSSSGFEGYEVSQCKYYIDDIWYNPDFVVTCKGRSAQLFENEYNGDVVIPSEVSFRGEVHSVTAINSNAFSNCTGLTSVILPETLTSIGNEAFKGCTGLTSVIIPESVKSIGSNAFYNCNGLTETKVILSGMDKFCAGTGHNFLKAPIRLFYQNEEITEYVVPEGVTAISNYAFQNCTSLASITLPESVTSIGSYAFDNCKALTNINIPEQVTSIADCTFGKCSSLTSITIPESVTSIGSSAFSSCSGLTSITIPESVISIGGHAFSGCTSLTSLAVPEGVTSMGQNVFYRCESLETLVIPFVGTSKDATSASSTTLFGVIFNSSSFEGSVSIKQYYNGSSYTTYYIPSSLRNVTITGGKLLYGAFYNCTDINITLGNDVEYIGDYAFCNCESSNITLGNAITYIGENAFDNVQNVKSLNIPEKVTYIGNHAFDNMKSLHTLNMARLTPPTLGAATALSKFTSIYVPTEAVRNAYLQDINWLEHQSQILTMTDQTGYDVTVEAMPEMSTLHAAIAPDNDLRKLQKVVSLKVTGTINSYDFMFIRNQMVNLKFLDLSDADIVTNSFPYYNDGTAYSSVENTLTRYALQPNLFSIKLPKSLTCIDNNALAELNLVEEIEIPANVTKIGDSALAGLSRLKNLTFAEGSKLQSIGVSAFASCPLIKELFIPGSVTVIYEGALSCSSLSKLVFEDGEKNMTLRASSPSDLLTEVYIGRNITSTFGPYSKSPVSSTSQLKKVTIGNGVTSIPTFLFSGSACNELVVPSSLKTIGADAFNGNKITDIYIEDVNAWCNIKGLQTLMSAGTAKNFYLNGEKIETLDLTGVETVSPYAFNRGTFTGLYMPKDSKLETIPDFAFANSQINKLQMPVSITSIGTSAFQNCAALTEVKLPSSIRKIGNMAFYGCNLLNDVYTYTIEPQSIDQNTFSTYTTATVHCPKVSFMKYLYNTQWNQFLKSVPFDEPYDYIFIDQDLTIDDNTGTIDGTPDADINVGAGLTAAVPLPLDDVHIKFDGNTNTGASLIGKVKANKIYLDLEVKANFWYAFCFPFDVDLKTIQKSGGYVFRYYDGQKRANGGSGWSEIAAGTEHLNAGEGYIFRTNEAGTLTIVVDKKTIDAFDLTVDKLTALNSYTATSGTTTDDNKSWNFVGNPYLSYFDMNDLGYTAPVVTFNGTTYEALRPGDDEQVFYPFQAFFVQKPENVDGVGFGAADQTTYIKSQNAQKKAQARARKADALNLSRKLINLTLTDGTVTDKTRVVFNDEQKMTYEAECDAAKFSSEGVPQFFSLDAKGTKYAINERPMADGVVKLGFTVPAPGEYTISATRMDAHVFLKDNQTGRMHDLSEGDYTFTASKGSDVKRFELVAADEETAISRVDADRNADEAAYDLNGRRVAKAQKGVNIVNGKKVMVK